MDKNKVPLGQSLQMNLTFNNTQNLPALELPDMEGFQSRYVGPSSRMSVINGQVSSSITHVYTLFPAKAGTFRIGPLKFDYNGDSYSSNVVNIEVVEGQLEEPAATAGTPQLKDISDRIFLVMQVQKNRAYLNEIIPLRIKLYVNRLGIRDIQYPEFNHEGFSSVPFAEPRQYQETIGGNNYEVIEFDTSIFGLRPQEFRLGSAKLRCNLIVKKQERKRQGPFGFDDFFDSSLFDDFFGRYETYPLDLKSTDIPITVLALPEENKPENFSGAVGEFDLEVTSRPEEVKVGDPVTLKITVKGDGNFNTVNIPKLSSEKDFKIYEPQVKQEKDQKTFEQILLPLNENVKEIPALGFGFFNTKTGQYQAITKGPFPIKVLKPDRVEALKIVDASQGARIFRAEEKLGRDIIYIKASLGRLTKKGEYLYKNSLFLLSQILPLLIFAILFVFHRVSLKLKTDPRYARQLSAPKKARQGIHKAKNFLNGGKTSEFYDALFQTLQEYLGDKFHLSSQGITISIIDEDLKQRNISEEVLIKLRDIFKACDMARYAASELRKEQMSDSLRQLQEVIDYFQRQRI